MLFLRIWTVLFVLTGYSNLIAQNADSLKVAKIHQKTDSIELACLQLMEKLLLNDSLDQELFYTYALELEVSNSRQKSHLKSKGGKAKALQSEKSRRFSYGRSLKNFREWEEFQLSSVELAPLMSWKRLKPYIGKLHYSKNSIEYFAHFSIMIADGRIYIYDIEIYG